MKTPPDLSPRVLVVNGFGDGRRMYVSYLRYAGIPARGAASPASALRLVKRFRPDIIVTDLVFPTGRLNGVGFIMAIRQHRNLPRPTVIVVSGLTREVDERHARNAGADGFLIKPCLPERLLAEVRRALAARRIGAAQI